jgi:hypothetical protein
MAQENPIPTRTALGIAAAACSLTLAAGITAASLLGYVEPGRRSFSQGAAETPAATNADPKVPASGVVLVPVEPTAPGVGNIGNETPGVRLTPVRHEERDEHAGWEDEHDDD